MNIIINLDTDNAAFDDDKYSEIVRILRELANNLENGETYTKSLRDINGNVCGGYHAVGK
jgi:hypothetical protein